MSTALLFSLTFLSCQKQKINQRITLPIDTAVVKAVEDSTAKVIISVNEEQFEFTKNQFELLQLFFNKLNKDYFVTPDIAYVKSQQCNFDDFKELKQDFSSEAGQDYFYIMYAYFLQQKNGIKSHETLRKKLLNIFRTINDLNGQLQYGGTYFGHQHSRIHGYVEYAVYKSIDNDSYHKEYDIGKQKNMFLQLLRQQVLDEERFDYETVGDGKIKRRNELMKMIDDLDGSINTFYDLRLAQEFQYFHYNWL